MSVVKHVHTRRDGRGGRLVSAEYRAYMAMKNRCLNKNQARYVDYGGRGITICERWLFGEDGRSGFECFLADMGPKPSPSHSIDRRETDDGYEPSNCRWATRQEQARNTRKTVHVYVCGCFMNLMDAADYFKAASPATIRRRLALGWDHEDAVLTPPGEEPIPPIQFPPAVEAAPFPAPPFHRQKQEIA